MKRDNKVRKEMKRYLLYIPQIFSFSFIRKEKKQKSDKEREGDKFLSTYQKLFFFFSSDKILFGGKFLCLFGRNFHGEASCSLFSFRENFLTRL